MSTKKEIFIIAIIITVVTIGGTFFLFDSKAYAPEIVMKDNTPIPPLKKEITPLYSITKDFKIVPIDEKGDKKIVLLTIDDGPGPQTIPMIKILEDNNVNVIFFVNGDREKYFPGIIKKEYEKNFVIGNHTWNHINLKKEVNEEVIRKEIDKTNKLIKNMIGEDPVFFRPPYGASSQYVRDYVKEKKMIFMNWTGSAKDWEYEARDENVFVSNVVNDLENGSIILIHEHPWSLNALPLLIKSIKEKGYTFADPKSIIKE